MSGDTEFATKVMCELLTYVYHAGYIRGAEDLATGAIKVTLKKDKFSIESVEQENTNE
jgi:ribosomal protein S8